MNRENDNSIKYLLLFQFIVLACFLLAVILMCSTPPVCRDSLTHHLAVPKLYLKHKGIYEIPNIEFSYYPQLLEILYSIPLYLKNDIVPKYIHWGFALATAFLVYKLIKKKCGLLWAVLGAQFFLSIPVILKLSVTIYVDLGLIFFSFASIFFIIEWFEKEAGTKFLFISACCCGLALSCKYNGLITLVLMCLLIPFFYILKNGDSPKIQLKALMIAVVYFTIACSVFSPWLIKNYLWTGNPLYPLFKGYFKPYPVDTTYQLTGCDSLEKKVYFNHFLVRKTIYNEGLFEILSIPIRVFFEGKDDAPKHFDGKLHPLLIILPLAGLLRKKKVYNDFSSSFLLSFSLLYILIVYVQVDMRARWIGPAIPCLSVLMIIVCKEMINWIRLNYPNALMANLGMFCLLFFMFVPNMNYARTLFGQISPIDYIIGNITREAYIEKFRPEFGVISYANRNLSPKAKIVCVFLGNRRYYSDLDLVMKNDLFNCTSKNINLQDYMFFFEKYSLTHIMVRYDLLNESIRNSPENVRARTHEFFSIKTELLFSKGGYGLYKLLR